MRRTGSTPDDNALDLMQRLRPLLGRFPYASLTLAGRDQSVVVLKARAETLDPDMLADLDGQLGLDDPTRVLSYKDVRRDIAKQALVEDDRLVAVRLAGEAQASDWLADLMVRGESATPVRPWLLAPVTQPPAGKGTRGKVICNCFDVSEDDIVAAFRAGESLDQLQARTRCGTNCGSCLPELKRLGTTAGNLPKAAA